MFNDKVVRQSDGTVFAAQSALRALIVQVQDEGRKPLGRRGHTLQQMLDILIGPQGTGFHAFAALRAGVHLLASVGKVCLELSPAVAPGRLGLEVQQAPSYRPPFLRHRFDQEYAIVHHCVHETSTFGRVDGDICAFPVLCPSSHRKSGRTWVQA